jgi:hypothetical protein
MDKSYELCKELHYAYTHSRKTTYCDMSAENQSSRTRGHLLLGNGCQHASTATSFRGNAGGSALCWVHAKATCWELMRGPPIETKPQISDSNIPTGSNIWSQVPQGCSIRRHTD